MCQMTGSDGAVVCGAGFGPGVHEGAGSDGEAVTTVGVSDLEHFAVRLFTHPETGAPTELARAWYERLPLLSAGPIADQGWGPYGDPALFLADGRSYRVETDDTLHVLTYLQGPYPKDFLG